MSIRNMVLGMGLLSLAHAAGAEAPGRTGDAILKMCQGADKVKALSMMCHNYLNGFLDASAYSLRQTGKGARYCLKDGDKERIPAALVSWMSAHPEALKLDAGEALYKMLGDSFSCGGKK